MANLANMFAVLDLDGEDDRKEVEQPTSSKQEATAAARKLGKGALFLSLPHRMDWDCVLLLVRGMRFALLIAKFNCECAPTPGTKCSRVTIMC